MVYVKPAFEYKNYRVEIGPGVRARDRRITVKVTYEDNIYFGLWDWDVVDNKLFYTISEFGHKRTEDFDSGRARVYFSSEIASDIKFGISYLFSNVYRHPVIYAGGCVLSGVRYLDDWILTT